MSRTDFNVLTDEIAKLRDAFLTAVPAAMDDHRFGEMMGSPWSVLYRVTEYFNDQMPAVPQPDWSQPPTWANWWAIAADGCVGWYPVEPQLLAAFGEWRTPVDTSALHDGMIDIPLGIDWRTLKQQRPQQEPQP